MKIDEIRRIYWTVRFYGPAQVLFLIRFLEKGLLGSLRQLANMIRIAILAFENDIPLSRSCLLLLLSLADKRLQQWLAIILGSVKVLALGYMRMELILHLCSILEHALALIQRCVQVSSDLKVVIAWLLTAKFASQHLVTIHKSILTPARLAELRMMSSNSACSSQSVKDCLCTLLLRCVYIFQRIVMSLLFDSTFACSCRTRPIDSSFVPNILISLELFAAL